MRNNTGGVCARGACPACASFLNLVCPHKKDAHAAAARLVLFLNPVSFFFKHPHYAFLSSFFFPELFPPSLLYSFPYLFFFMFSSSFFSFLFFSLLSSLLFSSLLISSLPFSSLPFPSLLFSSLLFSSLLFSSLLFFFFFFFLFFFYSPSPLPPPPLSSPPLYTTPFHPKLPHEKNAFFSVL